MTGARESAARWLAKAEHDLVAARRVLLDSDGPTDVICFLSQQAVEKALKGVLTAHGTSFERTHDLVALVDQVNVCIPGIALDATLVSPLNAYAVAVRYPGDAEDPSRETTASAVAVAEQVVDAVRLHLDTMADEGSAGQTKEKTTL